jgi:hypothetical protein
MPYPDLEPLSQAEQGRIILQNAQHDEEIIRRTLELIERSRALLEETKVWLLPPIGSIQTGGKQTSRRVEKGDDPKLTTDPHGHSGLRPS